MKSGDRRQGQAQHQAVGPNHGLAVGAGYGEILIDYAGYGIAGNLFGAHLAVDLILDQGQDFRAAEIGNFRKKGTFADSPQGQQQDQGKPDNLHIPHKSSLEPITHAEMDLIGLIRFVVYAVRGEGDVDSYGAHG